MTRIMVWLSALLAQSWLEHGSYEPGVAGSSPARSNIFFMFCANGGVVYRDELKPRYLRMRRFEPCFAHVFILIITLGLLLIFIPTQLTSPTCMTTRLTQPLSNFFIFAMNIGTFTCATTPY